MTRHTYISLLLLLCGLGMVHPGRAQQYNFKNYSVENGLPYIQIFAMCQDHEGYLWSGGYGGLSKFDGKKFTNYSPQNGLSNHWVNAIIEDTGHCIVVGTIDGLSVLKNKKISNYYMKDGLPSNNVTSFCLDYSGRLWIGTTRGLCYFDGNKIKPFPALNGRVIRCLYGSYNKHVYIGTDDGLMDMIPGADQPPLRFLDDQGITAISQCPLTKLLYVASHNGLHALDPLNGRVSSYHVNNGLLDEDLNTVLCQLDGTVWIGSKSGLISFKGSDFSYYTIDPNNNSNHIRSLLIDYEENLWIGTHNGLYRYRGRGFTAYDRQDGLGSALIYQVARDQQKNLWITSEANGLYRFADGYFKNYTVKNGLADNHTACILPMDDGSMWFGTANGISRLRNERFENITHLLKSMPSPTINCMYKDGKGLVWVGGHNLVCSLQKKGNAYSVTYYKLPTAAKDYEVWSIIEDDDGAIWAGTYLGGLYKLENDRFRAQSISIFSPVESVLELDKDERGNMYGATLNGILVFNPRKHSYKVITEKDGLNSGLVYTIRLTKDKKQLWAGTNQGVTRIDVDKLQNGIVDLTSYGKAEGFKGVECNTHGIYEDDDSCIWFGTVNGLMKYSPKEFLENTSLSRTNISSIKLGFQDTLLANGSVLPYAQNNITFEFVGICLTNPDKVKYTFMLEGFDKKWSPYTTENFVRYSSLPEGRYTFKVKSCNNEGIWTPESTRFSFTILPPFYRTWWFILACIVFVSSCIVLIFRYRLIQIKRKQRAEFEKQVEISKAELKALRAQMNPHFVFNSLNSIQHFILNSKGEEAVKYLSKFAKLIRMILNNSEKAMVTINEDLDSLKLYLELEQMRFDNQFDYRITIDEAIDPDYEEIPPMLMQPYLENAILHGINPMEGQGLITIDIRSRGNFIAITITDNGVGREKAMEMQSLLPPSKHKSLGMKITKDRVRILNDMYQSNLSVNIIDLYDSEKNALGTKVELFVPYQR